jgi:hypothetical protein
MYHKYQYFLIYILLKLFLEKRKRQIFWDGRSKSVTSSKSTSPIVLLAFSNDS